MIRWRDWEFYPVDGNLVLGDPMQQPPEFWNEGIRSIEATVETLLAFNLARVVVSPLRLLKRADAIEPSADIVATDDLARVHMFELKKSSFSGQAATQLEQYLLRHVFSDAEAFLQAAGRQASRQTSEYQVARDILCVHANERGGIVGYQKIRHELESGHSLLRDSRGRILSRYAYGRLTEREKLVRVHAALDRHAQKRGLAALPPIAKVQTDARRWSNELGSRLAVPQPIVRSKRRLVVWLVGSSISPDALERVRLWRRSGVDARVLRATARSDGSHWVLGVRREEAAKRDALESEVLDRAAETKQEPGTVRLTFYREMAASASYRQGGQLLEDPTARLWSSK